MNLEIMVPHRVVLCFLNEIFTKYWFYFGDSVNYYYNNDTCDVGETVLPK